MAETSPPNKSTKCYLLEIPPEIRNNIYDLVFAPDGAGEEIELVGAKTPDKSLVLSCRQIYREVKYVYRAACRSFWRETKFVITLEVTDYYDEKMWDENLDAVCTQVKGMAGQDVGQINHLRVTDNNSLLILVDKVWFEDFGDVEAEIAYVPNRYRAALEEATYRLGDTGISDMVRIDLQRQTVDVEWMKQIVMGRSITVQEIVAIVMEIGSRGG